MTISDVIDTRDLKSLWHEFTSTFRSANIVAKGYSWWDVKGDGSALFALFFDNLATQLTLCGIALQGGIPASFLWSHFMGGVGLSIFFGNLYYSLQASKVAMRTGNMNTCALPYGINTPGAIAKTFGILLPAYHAARATSRDEYEAAEKAWSLACAANFLGGVAEFLGAFVVPLITRCVPVGALLVPIGGVGITWLGLNPLVGIVHPHITHNVLVGFLPLVIMWMSFFGGVSFGKVPPGALATLVGLLLAWLVRAHDIEGAWGMVAEAADHVGAHGLRWSGCLGMLGEACTNHGSLVLGLACTNFIGTYACVLSAKKAGDSYSPMETMMVDGVGSMLGALFGSPYGTTVYIGHVAFKRMGAKRSYSLLNGVLYLVIGLFGLQGLLNACVPHECVLGIIFIIGFSMAAQCIEAVPSRWYPCVLVGLAICVSDYAVKGLSSPNKDITFLTQGYIWISFLYTFALMMLTDRWFLAAASIFLAMVPLSAVGLLHAAQLGWRYDRHGTLAGRANLEQGGDGGYGAPGWKYVVCYAVTSAFCALMHLLQRRGLVLEPEPEDFRALQAAEDAAHLPAQADDTSSSGTSDASKDAAHATPADVELNCGRSHASSRK